MFPTYSVMLRLRLLKLNGRFVRFFFCKFLELLRFLRVIYTIQEPFKPKILSLNSFRAYFSENNSPRFTRLTLPSEVGLTFTKVLSRVKIYLYSLKKIYGYCFDEEF